MKNLREDQKREKRVREREGTMESKIVSPSQLQPVILGADFCGYAYIRCFWEAYAFSSIVCATADIKAVARSRYADFRVVPDLDTQEGLMRTLSGLAEELSRAGKIPLLVGCGDHYAKLISQNKKELSEAYIVCYPSYDVLESLTQKDVFYRICEEIGIPYPKTIYLDCAVSPDAIKQEIELPFSYPVIAKPSSSAAYHYVDIPHKKKVFFIESPDELKELYTNLVRAHYKHSLVVQEYIPGEDDAMRIVSAFSDTSSDPVFLVGGRVLLEDHAPTAIGNPAIIIPEKNEEVLQDAAKFLKHVHFEGMANFDVKYDARDKTYKFFEINPRPGRSSFFAYQAGINFAKIMVEFYAQQKTLEQIFPERPFVYTTVPRYVAKRSIKDRALSASVREAFKSGDAQFPLFWGAEKLSQKFWAFLTYIHQIPKFKRYVWDPEKKRKNQ